jgi:hypothetical protein
VSRSSALSQAIACSRDSPHISLLGRNEVHTAGRCDSPNSAQRPSPVNWMQGTPAGLPTPSTNDMPGIGLEIDGAVQQAPQPGRQATSA